ncbi:MAG: RHS repeat-associated core domain-containing protein, partial [Pyrinomonadaceae bacterium]
GGGIDNKLKSTTGSTINYFLADHLGSTNGLTNSSGVVSATNGYDSFGNPTNTAFPTRYQFTGREKDSFSGLQFSRARFYDPNLGRFISEDPIGFKGKDINLYGYVRNNPLNSSDPLGLLPFPGYSNLLSSVYGSLFGDGGYLSGPTLGEFLSAKERSKRKCKSTWFQRFNHDFDETNAALPGFGAPSIFPGLGVGTLTGGGVARTLGVQTFGQWAASGFGGSVSGAATYGALETGVGVAVGGFYNTLLVTFSYEAGVAIGASTNATFGFTDYCPCGQ